MDIKREIKNARTERALRTLTKINKRKFEVYNRPEIDKSYKLKAKKEFIENQKLIEKRRQKLKQDNK